jgi:hypothetical protein
MEPWVEPLELQYIEKYDPWMWIHEA